MKDLTDIEKKILRKRKLLEKRSRELGDLIQNCPHTNTIEKEEYVEGTYYDKAYTEYWTFCSVCGKTMNKRTEMHSWHG